MIGGPLKLAVKYEVTDMVAAFHAVIYRDWPNIYAEWLEVEEQIRTERKLICDAELEGVCPEYDVNCSTPNSGRLVRLVQDGHAGWALRAAWYELARSYGQGCIPFRNESPYNHEHVTRRTAKLSVLDANDLRRLVVGRERMVDMVGIVFDELCHHELFSALPAGTTPRNARYHQPCAEKSTQILQRYEKGELYLEMTRDPLEVFRRMQLEIDRAQAVCSSCRRSAMHALTEACQQIWDALDDIFDLKSLRRDLGSYED
ncbi:hypothetical protein PsYK624_092590 [Phanerochaete sordida]|uniref:Uncharacterized protein n=1 Tax=Phanerochaete sordida TaxID=48140 RepID=A0A9P3LFA3_9APHY|nr:hypothetical protein PsYK624_092590 [Phanerochaete sordida]